MRDSRSADCAVRASVGPAPGPRITDRNFPYPFAREPPGGPYSGPVTQPLLPNAFEPAPRRNGKFHNASGLAQHGLAGALRWLLTRSRGPWPTHVEDVPVAPPVDRVDDGSIRATVIGHATVLVHVDGLNILTDPVMSMRIGPTSWTGP